MSDHTSLPDEVWLPVRRYETHYDVSSFGRVRRIRAGKGAGLGRILKPIQMPNGYVKVHLSRNNVKDGQLIHRLVCAAFHLQPAGADKVDHIDGKWDNNFSNNVRWVDQKENMRHAQYDLQTFGVLKSADIVEIRSLYKTAQYSQKDLGEKFGVAQAHISMIVRGTAWDKLGNASIN